MGGSSGPRMNLLGVCMNSHLCKKRVPTFVQLASPLGDCVESHLRSWSKLALLLEHVQRLRLDLVQVLRPVKMLFKQGGTLMTRQTCSRRKQWSGPRLGVVFFFKNEPWLWCGQLFLRREQQSQPRVLHL